MDSDGTQRRSARMLCELAADNSGAPVRIVNAGAISPLVSILSKGSEEAKGEAIDALSGLAANEPSNQLAIATGLVKLLTPSLGLEKEDVQGQIDRFLAKFAAAADFRSGLAEVVQIWHAEKAAAETSPNRLKKKKAKKDTKQLKTDRPGEPPATDPAAAKVDSTAKTDRPGLARAATISRFGPDGKLASTLKKAKTRPKLELKPKASTSPKGSPKGTPKGTPKGAGPATPKGTPKGTPKANPKSKPTKAATSPTLDIGKVDGYDEESQQEKTSAHDSARENDASDASPGLDLPVAAAPASSALELLTDRAVQMLLEKAEPELAAEAAEVAAEAPAWAALEEAEAATRQPAGQAEGGLVDWISTAFGDNAAALARAATRIEAFVRGQFARRDTQSKAHMAAVAAKAKTVQAVQAEQASAPAVADASAAELASVVPMAAVAMESVAESAAASAAESAAAEPAVAAEPVAMGSAAVESAAVEDVVSEELEPVEQAAAVGDAVAVEQSQAAEEPAIEAT